MPRITFWNVRHLSAGSDDDRKHAIGSTLKAWKADLMFFSELTPQSVWPPAQNLTYRRANSHQLCYGCLDNTWTSQPLVRDTPTTTADYEAATSFKGPRDFTELADRALAYFGTVNSGGQQVHIYVLHAPAGKGSAKKAVAFAACYLNQHHGNTPWLMIGDLNVEPDDLASAPVGIQLGDLILAPSEPTKVGRTRDKTYDYVLCNFKDHAKIRTVRTSSRFHGSDHYPVCVEW